MKADWPFDDPPNTAAMTSVFVLNGYPILRVYHDYDGDWQFHGSPDDPATADVGRVVSLGAMISLDVTLAELHDLPYGWCATRTSEKASWQRQKNNPFPTHADDGYYLEDAVWMSQYRDDVNPPSEDLRTNLTPGRYVKLLFRFAAEDAERGDNQTERMWVLIVEVDEDENYVGTLENDPHHEEVLACGDTIHFHSQHVMEILDDEDD